MSRKDFKTLSDEALVDLLLSSRNSKIFEEIYDRYARKVFGKCLSFTRDRNEAEDYTHDILVKVYMHLSSFRKSARFSTWLYAITYNHCVSKQKLSKKEREMREQYFMEVNEGEKEPGDEDLFQIQTERLKFLMDMMVPEERMLLLLKYQDGLSIKELSELFNLKESAVKMRLKRSKAKLLTLYKDKYAHNVF